MKILEVKVFFNNKISFYECDNDRLKIGYNVIVNSEYGNVFGEIIKIFDIDDIRFKTMKLEEVVRVSTKKDYSKNKENVRLQNKALYKCRELVKRYNLKMNIINAFYNLDRTQLMFKFVADGRVDFRELAKELGAIFRTRIELRQVGIRDKAREIGGFGPCGRLLCCSSFLKSFDTVTISMAKNQKVSLNPNKINGVCGRLFCCLRYENEDYLLDGKNHLRK